MKISIITPVLNGEKTIRGTIESVLAQTHPDVEYIIVDGGSTDGTLDIVKGYSYGIARVVSGSDAGIYDAMNKGILRSSGEIVGILNADDVYESRDTLEKVAGMFEKTGADACWGDLVYVRKDDVSRVTRVWKTGEFSKKKLKNGWAVPHPAFFVKKSVYERVGLYRDDFKIAGDYEFMLRMFTAGTKPEIRTAYAREILVRMREGGASGGTVRKRREGWKELKKAWRVNDLSVPKFFILRRIFPKARQFFRI